MAAGADFSRSFLEEMVEGVCSSLTGETEMAQNPPKRRSWRSSASCGLTIAKRAVAYGPSHQGSSWKRWACANCGNQNRSLEIIGATHTETLPIGRIEKSQP